MSLRGLFARLLARKAGRVGCAVTGAVDTCRDGVLTGWMHDSRRPGESLSIDVLVDGTFAASGIASEARADLAAMFGGDGRHGFAIAVDALAIPSLERRHVTVRLANEPDDAIGPFEVPPSWDAGRSTFAGVGRFTEIRLSDEAEEAIFRERLVRGIARRAGRG